MKNIPEMSWAEILKVNFRNKTPLFRADSILNTFSRRIRLLRDQLDIPCIGYSLQNRFKNKKNDRTDAYIF